MTTQEQIDQYRILLGQLKTQEKSYVGVKRFTIRAIKPQIDAFHLLLEKFNSLHEELLRDKLTKAADPVVEKYLQAIESCIDKIQFVYLIRLSLKEGRRLNFYNVMIAAFAISVGILCTFYSLWRANKDSEPGQQMLVHSLKEDSVKLQHVLQDDSILLKQIRNQIIPDRVIGKNAHPSSEKPGKAHSGILNN